MTHLLITLLFAVIPWNLDLIRAPEAWTITRGSSDVVIAIIDSGIYAEHEEFPNGIVPGYDFVHNDTEPADDHGHGTRVASVAAGATVGVCPECSIMPLKALAETPTAGGWQRIADATVWATSNGADVILYALGDSQPSGNLHDTIVYAQEHGVFLVAAAGSSGTDAVICPACYPGVLGVSATTKQDEQYVLSNVGAHVDISAPGESIKAAHHARPGYTFASGSSIAAAHVAGLAGLLLSQGHDAADVARIIVGSAVDLGAPGYDVEFGHGRIDAWAAVRGGTATVPPVRVWRWWLPWVPVQ